MIWREKLAKLIIESHENITDSSLEDFAYENGISPGCVFRYLDKCMSKGTKCEECKHIGMGSMFPCNACSRNKDDFYEKDDRNDRDKFPRYRMSFLREEKKFDIVMSAKSVEEAKEIISQNAFDRFKDVEIVSEPVIDMIDKPDLTFMINHFLKAIVLEDGDKKDKIIEYINNKFLSYNPDWDCSKLDDYYNMYKESDNFALEVIQNYDKFKGICEMILEELDDVYTPPMDYEDYE